MCIRDRLLPADDPRAFLQLETLVSNWLVRTAELIGAELLDACGDWPELRRYLLRDPLLATRELDRLRNRLNTQLRWADLGGAPHSALRKPAHPVPVALRQQQRFDATGAQLEQGALAFVELNGVLHPNPPSAAGCSSGS